MSNSTGRFDCLVENKEKKNIFKQSPKKQGRFNNDIRDDDRGNTFKQRRPEFKKVYRGRGDYNSFSRRVVSEKKEEPKKFEMKEEDFPTLDLKSFPSLN